MDGKLYTINATYDTVSHVNNFLGLNISDTPWQVMTSNFASHNFLFVVLALLVPIVSYLTQVLNIKLMPQAAPSNGNNENDMAAQQMKMMKHKKVRRVVVFTSSHRIWKLPR